MQTIGSVIDQLIVTNLKIWHLIDESQNRSLVMEERFSATEKVYSANKQRNILIDELDNMINEAIKRQEAIVFEKNKLYK